jgi:peptidyl-prolyl cis-trans isomerase SurA
MKQVIVFVALLLCASRLTASEKFDGIAAVIGDSVVLLSELDAYALVRSGQAAPKPDSSELQKLRRQYCDDLINGKVLIVHAAKDTTIVVKDAEVEAALSSQVQQILGQNNMTMAQLEKELKDKYNMGFPRFKAQMRTQIQEQMIKQKVQQQYVSAVQVSKKDVEDFYNAYRDSLPKVGESVSLSKLTVKLMPPDSVRQRAFAKIGTIKRRLDNGEDFAALAKQFSEDPSAENGGDLGFIGKGTLNELKFEETAFSLAPGQTSGMFETRLGFHIIKVEAKKDQTVHVRQIFVAVSPAQDAVDRVKAQLDSVRSGAKTRDDFIASVRKFCTDAQLKSRDGKLGWIPLYSLPEAVRSVIDSLAVGQVSLPVRDGNEFVQYRLDDRKSNRNLTLEDDFDFLAEKAKEITAQKKLLDLVKKWRHELYIDVRL